uniref:Uncharacterized protein n=1 Tax=Avena sativa TaxID=4498 RepID=A0ACD5Z9S0_AVESA
MLTWESAPIEELLERSKSNGAAVISLFPLTFLLLSCLLPLALDRTLPLHPGLTKMDRRRKLVCATSSCFFALNVAAFGIICPPTETTSLPIGPFGFGTRFVAVVSVLLGLQVGVAYAAACFKYFFLIHSPIRNFCLDLEIHGLRKICLLLVTLAADTVTYQAGLSPSGGVWAVTDEWEHRRYKGSNQVKDQGRRHQMEKILYAGAPAYARHTLKNIFKVIGIPQKLQAANALSESTSMGSNRDTEPDNTSGSDTCRVAENNGINAVAETAATWLVASAATHHATGNRSLLSGFKTVDDLNIQTGDGRRMPVSGRGCVITETVLLPDVWFVPGLNQNIVSISQLIKLGCRVQMNHDACYICGATDGTIIGEAPVGENGMFKLEFLKVPLVN